MDPPPALSVVVPTHDTRELTLRCLAALAAADPPPREVVVVDDGSSDGTAAAVAESYPGVRLVRRDAAGGFTAAANAGMAVASGAALLLLNSDTEVSPGALGALAGAFAADPRLGIAGGSLVYPGGAPQWSGGRAPGIAWLFALASGLARQLGALGTWRRRRPVSGHGRAAARGHDARAGVATTPATVPMDWVTGAALAIRRETWLAAGPLDDRFAVYCQDLDLCLSAGDRGWRVAVVPAAVVLHHHGATLGRVAGFGAGGYHAPALWSDLVLFAGKRGGPRAAARAARALRFGAGLRHALLWGGALGGAARRRRAASERQALLEASRAVRAALHAVADERPGAPVEIR